jgi:hypothetical protein
MELTIDLLVYMARDVMILMGENPFRGLLEGVGPENEDFWALKWQRAKRVPFSAVSFSFVYRNIDAIGQNTDISHSLVITMYTRNGEREKCSAQIFEQQKAWTEPQINLRLS